MWTILVRVDAQLTTATLRARTLIHRTNQQPVLAIVMLGFGSRIEQWLPHEFEHVIEHLDGLDLRTVGSSGAWEARRDVFESYRAVAAGLAVLGEVRAFRPSAGE